MKTKNRIWLCPLIVMGLVLILTDSCKKDEDSNIKITDVDGNVYKTVTIGTQVWMAENLKTTRYRNGDLIGTTNPDTLDILSESTPKYQWAYEGSELIADTYGRLYTEYAVTDSRNVCPTGWHVPTNAEFTTLTTFLGGESVAGVKLKEAGTKHWRYNNPSVPSATNETGFTALPSGYRASWGFPRITQFEELGYSCGWWSSMGSQWETGYIGDGAFFGGGRVFEWGFSVRCLRD
jgi:uncharacterized protein (TIGR02145 family)